MHSLLTVSTNAENSLLHRYVDKVEKGHSAPFHSDIELNLGCNPKQKKLLKEGRKISLLIVPKIRFLTKATELV
jgi:hypothetical protein